MPLRLIYRDLMAESQLERPLSYSLLGDDQPRVLSTVGIADGCRNRQRPWRTAGGQEPEAGLVGKAVGPALVHSKKGRP